MNIIELYENLKGSYKSYLESFIAIKDERIKEKVSDSIKNEKLWPKALIQFNPNFEKGIGVKELIAKGLPIHKDLEYFFDKPFYKHQQEAIELGCQDKEFIVTSGTGSGKSRTFMATIFNYVLLHEESSKDKTIAIIVYPMNALINSQAEELSRYKAEFEERTNESSFVCSPIPNACGVGNSTTLLYAERGTMPVASLYAMLSSLVFDYTTKQKIGGSHASISFVKQFPVLTPDQIPSAMQWQIVKRVAELCYFNHDMDGWASELWEEMNEEQRAELPQLEELRPWIYNPERRAILQAELDAIFAHLYGLNTEDLRYILDPEDVCGKGCINETFRVLKDNEIRQYGEYRTKRLVLEAWNKFGYNI